MYACRAGVEDIASLLPCEISTDPEENYDVAAELVAIDQGKRASWLLDRFPWQELHADYDVDSDYYRRTRENGSLGAWAYRNKLALDVFVIAQQLAMYADKMLTRKGK